MTGRLARKPPDSSANYRPPHREQACRLQSGAEPPPSAALQRGRPSGLGTAESRGRQLVLLDGPSHPSHPRRLSTSPPIPPAPRISLHLPTQPCGPVAKSGALACTPVSGWHPPSPKLHPQAHAGPAVSYPSVPSCLSLVSNARLQANPSPQQCSNGLLRGHHCLRKSWTSRRQEDSTFILSPLHLWEHAHTCIHIHARAHV